VQPIVNGLGRGAVPSCQPSSRMFIHDLDQGSLALGTLFPAVLQAKQVVAPSQLPCDCPSSSIKPALSALSSTKDLFKTSVQSVTAG
jgi:hypothetical protein